MITPIKRFYLLDILRGLASFAVVVWHYQHFFQTAPGVLPTGFNRAAQPFYPLLSLLYEHGGEAVLLFFTLSGFVFFWRYYEEVHARRVSGWQFFIFRFSRLYPLHFITLLLVAGIQLLQYQLHGQFIVYSNNDLPHFILNLFFISHWGLQDGWSFNGPVWSVSIEIILYMVFFAYATLGLRSAASIAILMLLGLGLTTITSNGLGTGLFCFFAGGGVFMLYDQFQAAARGGWHRRALALAAGGALSASLLIVHLSDGALLKTVLYGLTYPSIILLLALLQSTYRDLGARLRIIGDITYSTYLLHFPLQLMVIVSASALGANIDFNSPAALLAYLASVFVLSVISYHNIELPTQRYIRRRLLGRSPLSAPTAANDPVPPR